MDLKIIDVGGMEVTSDKDCVLKTFVGSCVALCLYDSKANVAGMSHVMLPEKKMKGFLPRRLHGKYADIAIDTMLDEMTNCGADPKRIQAKMAGGAKVFQHEGDPDQFDVGKNNLKKIRLILYNQGIPIVAQDSGRTTGRWVKFVVETDEMFVGDITNKEKKL